MHGMYVKIRELHVVSSTAYCIMSCVFGEIEIS